MPQHCFFKGAGLHGQGHLKATQMEGSTKDAVYGNAKNSFEEVFGKRVLKQGFLIFKGFVFKTHLRHRPALGNGDLGQAS